MVCFRIQNWKKCKQIVGDKKISLVGAGNYWLWYQKIQLQEKEAVRGGQGADMAPNNSAPLYHESDTSST